MGEFIGSGVLKLIGGIRILKQANREMTAAASNRKDATEERCRVLWAKRAALEHGWSDTSVPLRNEAGQLAVAYK